MRRHRIVLDMHGRPMPVVDTTDMVSPVKCLRCGAVYDLGKVKPVDRHQDCTTWISPCCKKLVDDRQRPWTGSPDIEPVGRRSR